MTVDLVLNDYFNHENLITIIQRAYNYGVKYYDYIAGERYLNSSELKNENAALAILTKKYENSSLLCKYQDITFYLGFYNEHERIKISLWGSGDAWKSEFLNGIPTVEFDMQRYIRFMLSLLNDFKINKIEARIEWD